MTKPCVVPQCKTGSRSLKIKRSVFKVPSNSERLKKWQSAIPKRQLTSSHYVCEKHFEEQYILRKYIKHDANGRVVAEVLYKHPCLTASAIPTIFDESNEKTVEGCNDSTIIDCAGNCVDGSTINDHTGNLVGMSPGHDSIKSVAMDEFLVPMDIDAAIHSNDVLMDVPAEETAYDYCSSSMNDTPISATEILMTNTPGNADLPPHQVVTNTTFDISPVTISGNSSSVHLEDCVERIESLPVPWVVAQLSAQPDQRLVFLYPEVTKKRGIEIPVTAKTVTVDGQKNLRYYVHGNLVNHDQANLRQKLDSLTHLPDILIKFQHMKLCCGIGEVDIHFLPTEESFKNYNDEWHHNKCSLVWKKLRCENCCKLRKNILQKEKRTKNLYSRNRISRLSNPVDEQKMRIIKNKMRCERRGKNRAKCRLSIAKVTKQFVVKKKLSKLTNQ